MYSLCHIFYGPVNYGIKAHPLIGSWSWQVAADSVVWTPALYELFGLDPLLPPPNWSQHGSLYTPEAFATLESAVQHSLSTGEPFALDLEGIHTSGRVIFLEVYGAVECDENGAITTLYGQCIDRTAQTLALRELALTKADAENANVLKSHFLSMMSHEIRTPLNAIIGMAELLEYDSKRSDVKQCLHTIHTSGDTLLTLINDILDFSKIEADQIDLEKAPVNIRECAESALGIVSSMLEEKNLEFQLTIDPSLPKRFLGDSVRLRQVLLNLLMNAGKFTERGKVTLDIAQLAQQSAEPKISFEVTDTGIGMAAEELDKLFQMFSQANASIAPRCGGAALGLAISQKLITLMGGAIIVKSEPGLGSSFRFSLPLIPAIKQPNLAELNTSEQDAGFFLGMNNPLKILIAEDNKINQQVIELMLSRLGYDDVKLVTNGLEALHALEKDRFDLILMDIEMPVMNGLQATEAIIKNYPEQSRPQIVALTANATKKDRAISMAAGMNDYLVKPLRRERLIDALQEVYAQISQR